MSEETITIKLLAQDLMSGNIGKAVAKLDQLAQKGGLVGSVAQGVGQSFGQLLNPMGLVTGAVGAVVGSFDDWTDAASDLAESQSKTGVVFEGSARKVLAWSTTAAKAMGMSQQAALEAAGTYGNLFTAMGLGEDAAAGMSTELVQLASDLASFNNIGTDDVLDKLQAGITGEAEPLKALGVAMNEARVKAYGLANGLADAKGNMSEAAKISARYKIILQDTRKAQGDFARTSDGQANKSRAAAAAQEDLNAKLGGFIAPLRDIGLDIGLAATNTVLGLGEAFHDLQRWIDPGIRDAEDLNAELTKLAEGKGLDADVVLAYVEASKKAEKARDVELQQTELLRQAYMNQEQLYGDLTDEQEAAFQAWRKTDEGIQTFNGTIGQNTKALAENKTAQQLAADTLGQYMSAADLATRSGIGLDAMLAEVGDRMKQLGITWVESLGMVGQEVNEKRFRPMGAAAADAFTSAYLASWDAAWKGTDVAADVRRPFRLLPDWAYDKGAKTGENFADGYRSAEDDVRSAGKLLSRALKHPWDEAKERAQIEGGLTGKRLARGIAASRNDPVVKARTQQYIDAQVERIGEMREAGYDMGRETAMAFAAGLALDPKRYLSSIVQGNPRLFGTLDKLGGIFGRVFGGGRAAGGPVSAGRSYLVGESGPELLTMGASNGHVTPNARLGGMELHVHYSPTYSTAGIVEAQRFVEAIFPALRRKVQGHFGDAWATTAG